MFRSTIYATLLLLLFTQSTQAASLVVNSNTIIGASGVNVNGILYDVAIGDGTCVSLFNGCDQSADFPFASSDDTINALQALLPLFQLPSYKNSPESIAGCENTTFHCVVLTPHVLFTDTVFSRYLIVRPDLQPDVPNNVGYLFDEGYDLTTENQFTYARWTRQPVNPIPEPNALMLLGIGLLSQRWLRARGKRVPV